MGENAYGDGGRINIGGWEEDPLIVNNKGINI